MLAVTLTQRFYPKVTVLLGLALTSTLQSSSIDNSWKGTHGILNSRMYSNLFRISQRVGLEMAVHASFLAFWHVRALFREIANQSLYTSHNIADFLHLWFCEKLDKKLSQSHLWRFVKIPVVWREQRNARWEKWLARWFTKCHLYTYRFSHFVNIFSCSRQFDDKCISWLKAKWLETKVGSIRKGQRIVTLFQST